MSRNLRTMAFILLAFGAIWLAGCSDLAEDALEEATDFNWDLDNEEANAPIPENWYFLFAVDLNEDQAKLIDQDFSVDVSLLADVVDLNQFGLQIVFAKVDKTPNGSDGLRYANKVLVADEKIKLDGQSLDLLGPSIGSSGAGWYVCFAATEPVGFITGEVTDCDGNAPPDDTVLVTATDGPFFTFARSEGSWALPSLNGKPAMVNFDAGDCAGATDAPVTDPEANPDPKDPGAEPDGENFDDGTDNGPLPDGTEDEGTNVVLTAKVNLSAFQPEGGEPGDNELGIYEFDDGVASWSNTGDCFNIYNDADDYAFLFPGGTDAGKYFAYISTGSPTQSGLQACTVMRTFTVPEGATKIVVSYDFVSQEYEEWLGSAYNDVLTIQIQGEVGYIEHRTINGDNYWEQLTPAQGDIGFIADSADAQYNPTNANPYSNGPYLLDGHLKWGSESQTPRGEDDGDDVYGRVAEYDLPANNPPTITVLMTVSDVADAIYDSVLAIDYIAFE